MSKRFEFDDPPTPWGYLMTFSSVSIILLAFFVYFSSIGVTVKTQELDLRMSLHRVFSSLAPSNPPAGKEPGLKEFELQHLSPRSITGVRDEGQFIFEVSAEQLFVGEAADISAGFIPLLHDLTQVIRQSECQLRIDVIAERSSWNRDLARTAALTRLITDTGFDRAEILARGAHVSGQPGQIAFTVSGCR